MNKDNSNRLKFNGGISLKLQPNNEITDDRPYRVYGINRSEYHVTKFRIVGKPVEIVLPEPLKHTCDLADCKACHDAQKYEIFAVFQCDDPTMEIQLYLKHPTNGNEGWGHPNWTIEPDCNYAGEVQCINEISSEG
ncbi:hypothetical protein OCB14_29170 [Bacillus cereus]|uniref:Uncharacterized protein n=1 Tax=Bacillus cereus TaxID=1396 RepID=A0A9X0MB18_BACCE|nr:hypothetical protein [Bacillus cereus]KXY28655.1 hypothetical protein AT268_15375 [Bacillus cereus]MCU5529152.1 hypothetical protein [Bacillus cereus]MCU5545672.1 hypothetical protein [Bacillus cereus]